VPPPDNVEHSSYSSSHFYLPEEKFLYGSLHFSALTGTVYAVSITFYIDFCCFKKMKNLVEYIYILCVNNKNMSLLHK